MLRRLLILMTLLFASAPAFANQDPIPKIKPQLVIDGPVMPGQEVDLAILMTPDPGWHGYWLNPGDAGLPMRVQWLTPGMSVGELRYPLPTRLTIAGLMNYVYEGPYAVLTRVKIPPDAKGIFHVIGAGEWLACTDKVCVPERGVLQVRVPIGGGRDETARFDEWRRALSQPLVSPARFELSGQKLRVAIPLPSDVDIGEPYVFPISDGPVDYAGEQHFRRSGDTLVAELPRRRGEPKEFAGVLALGDGRGLEFKALPGAVPQGGRSVGDLGARAILLAVLGALAGGLLLNLMPCVFPILALKAMHLAKSGGEAAHARRDALAYAAGAVVGTGALGAALLAIRAGGSAAGWAFQLQEPRTIMLLMLLSVAITANLMGLFQLPALAGRARPSGGFATGALAAFVATPCAGPFLGAALGTALLLPAAGSVLVFAALGLGLAIPFLAVGFVPALRRRLPKPGPWMARLQRFLAIPMAATAAACLWLLYRQGAADALLAGLAATAVLAVVLAWFGSRQRGGSAVGWAAVPALIGLAAVAILFVPQRPENAVNIPRGTEAWSEARVASHLQQDRPVFVYFTADWCLTCKANEVTAIDRSDVRAEFKKGGVKVLAGDWTNGDPAITRFLESRGRAGVPLYLWYRPGAEPEELPQILTASMLISRARSQP